MTLRITDAAPLRGVAWVSGAFALFLKQPLAYTLLLLLFLVAALVLLALPLIGPLLLLAALPLLSLGFMAATRDAQRGQPVRVSALFEAIGPRAGAARRGALVRLCVLYAAATALVMLLSNAADGGAFERLQQLVSKERTPEITREIDALLTDPRLVTGVLLRFALSALLSVPFWHAPALVAWHAQGVAQSLFSSTLACWRNKGAFTLYGVAWVAAVSLFGALAGVAIAVLGNPAVLTAMAVPAGLFFGTVFYVSLYATFSDCFAEGTEVNAAPADST
jgi:hypothetical protein